MPEELCAVGIKFQGKVRLSSTIRQLNLLDCMHGLASSPGPRLIPSFRATLKSGNGPGMKLSLSVVITDTYMQVEVHGSLVRTHMPWDWYLWNEVESEDDSRLSENSSYSDPSSNINECSETKFHQSKCYQYDTRDVNNHGHGF